MEMKKMVTWVLLVTVVVVWGTVIVKVVRGMRPEKVAVIHEVAVVRPVSGDSDTLRLDYRDPFLGEFVRVRPAVEEERVPVLEEPEDVPVPDFTFKGLIGNGDGRKAMVMRGGELLMLVEGDSVGVFEVVGFSPGVMVVECGGCEMEVKVR